MRKSKRKINQIEVEGHVVAMSKGHVEISIGHDDGIERLMKLTVFRDRINRGRIEIIRLNADRSIGRIIEQGAEAPIRAGDQVIGSIQEKTISHNQE